MVTAIVGIVDKGKVWLGGDNVAVGGYDAHARTEAKVFVAGSCIVGVAGSQRVAQLIRYKMDLKDDLREDAHQFMCTQFVDRLSAILNDNWSRQVKENVAEIPDSVLMVGLRGRLFTVYGDFQVLERSQGYNAIGCGQDLCLGSLYATHGGKLNPEQRIKHALNAAEEFSAGVRGPFTVIHQ